MNIFLITRFYPPDTGGGGIAAYARYAAHGLTQAGHQVQIISMLAENSNPFQMVEGIPVYRLSSSLRSYRWTKLPVVGRQIRFLRDWIYSLQVRKFLLKHQSQFRPDIVEYADIDAEGLNHPQSVSPYIVKLHTSHAILKEYYTKPEIPYALAGIEQIEKTAIVKAQGISSPSNYLASEVSQKLSIERSKIHFVPNFIDTEYYEPFFERAAGGTKEVLYVGRIEPRKGALIFAEAIPEILKVEPNVHFTFAGADRSSQNGQSQKDALQRYFSNLGHSEHVTFIGHAPPEVYKKLYQNADVFVMPSLFENCPYTLLEAMSCGCACVVHKSSGMTEMVQDYVSGLFFANADPIDLAEKVLELLRDPELRKFISRNARQQVLERYSLEVGTRETVKYYQTVLGIGGELK